jgi:hypothetical protein
VANFKKHVAGEGGWSEWTQPVMRGYRLACCDCCLVHDMEFKVLKVTKQNPDGSWEAEEIDSEKYRVEFRARRNNRSTAQLRRQERARQAKQSEEDPSDG